MSRALLDIIINFSQSPRDFIDDDHLGLLGDPLGRCCEDGIIHLQTARSVHKHVPLFAGEFKELRSRTETSCLIKDLLGTLSNTYACFVNQVFKVSVMQSLQKKNKIYMPLVGNNLKANVYSDFPHLLCKFQKTVE